SAIEQEGSALALGGTEANDTVVVRDGNTRNTIEVLLNNISLGTFATPSLFLFYGGPGNDRSTIAVSGLPTFQDGGAGTDMLQGGNSGNILLGGPGNDVLTGGPGRDILVGGSGPDVLKGLGGDDILIGGATDFDTNITAWQAILAEWQRSDVDYVTRVHHLDG